jgi:hypothetical protein
MALACAWLGCCANAKVLRFDSKRPTTIVLTRNELIHTMFASFFYRRYRLKHPPPPNRPSALPWPKPPNRWEPATACQAQLRYLYCATDIAQHESYLLSPAGQIDRGIIIPEKDNVDRIIATR